MSETTLERIKPFTAECDSHAIALRIVAQAVDELRARVEAIEPLDAIVNEQDEMIEKITDRLADLCIRVEALEQFAGEGRGAPLD